MDESLLANVLFKQLADHRGALLGDALLPILVVDECDAEAGLVSFGPLKVAAHVSIDLPVSGGLGGKGVRTPTNSMPDTS